MLEILAESLRTILGARLDCYIIAVLLYLLSIYMFARAWALALEALGYEIEITRLIPPIFAGFFVSNLTLAGRVTGEILRVLWIARDIGVRLLDGISSLLLVRIAELIPATILGIATIYLKAFPSEVIRYLILYIVLLAVAIYAYEKLLAGWLERRLGLESASILESMRIVLDKGRIFAHIFLLMGGLWILEIARLGVLARSIEANLTILQISGVSVAYFLLAAFPLTPGGLGVVESGLPAIMVVMGTPVEKALALTILERSISYVFSSSMGGLFIALAGGREIWRALR